MLLQYFADAWIVSGRKCLCTKATMTCIQFSRTCRFYIMSLGNIFYVITKYVQPLTKMITSPENPLQWVKTEKTPVTTPFPSSPIQSGCLPLSPSKGPSHPVLGPHQPLFTGITWPESTNAIEWDGDRQDNLPRSSDVACWPLIG